MKRSELILGVLRVPLDYVLALSAFFAAYFFRAQVDLSALFKQPDLLTFPPLGEYQVLAASGALLFTVVMTGLGAYSFKRPRSFSAELKVVLWGSLVWIMGVITYYFFIRAFPFSRLVLFIATFFLFGFVALGRTSLRVLRRALLRYGVGKRSVVIIGGNEVAQKLTHFFKNAHAFRLMKCVPTLEALKEFRPTLKGIDEIFHSHSNKDEARKIIDLCREHHIEYHFVPEILELHRSDYSMITLGGVPIITLLPSPLEGWQRVLKRGFDFILALVGLVVLSPFLLIIAVLIKVDSRGPVFFRYLDNGEKAMRVGERGKLFCCLKFRTMRNNSHNLRYTELAQSNTRKGSPLVKIKNDPRVTRVGKFLRQYSIDELPQLWNVLIGEMSLVGPRPHLPEEVERYDQHHKFVLTLKPGITGLAQINGRSDLDFEQEVRLDTFYIENWSLWLDIKILFKTIGVVIRPYRE